MRDGRTARRAAGSDDKRMVLTGLKSFSPTWPYAMSGTSILPARGTSSTPSVRVEHAMSDRMISAVLAQELYLIKQNSTDGFSSLLDNMCGLGLISSSTSFCRSSALSRPSSAVSGNNGPVVGATCKALWDRRLSCPSFLSTSLLSWRWCCRRQPGFGSHPHQMAGSAVSQKWLVTLWIQHTRLGWQDAPGNPQLHQDANGGRNAL